MHYHPTVTINSFTYRGDINYNDIRQAICAAYRHKPTMCDLGAVVKEHLKEDAVS